MADAHVRVAPGSHRDQARSDAEGVFQLERVVPGACRVEVDDEVLGRVARRRGVAATRCDPVEVEVRPGGTVEVTLRVRDAR